MKLKKLDLILQKGLNINCALYFDCIFDRNFIHFIVFSLYCCNNYTKKIKVKLYRLESN